MNSIGKIQNINSQFNFPNKMNQFTSNKKENDDSFKKILEIEMNKLKENNH